MGSWDLIGGAVNWNKEISEATSPLSVVAIANNFIAELARKDLTGVPADCIPGYIENPEDIDRWRLKLATEYCRPGASASQAIRFQDLVVFFMNASARLEEVAGPSTRAEETPRPQSGRTAT